MKKNLGLLRKLGILATLLFCLSWVSFNTTTQSSAAARPCCTQCPLSPEDFTQTPQEYCEDQCGANSGTCYTQCLNQVYSCWRWCVIGC